MHANLPKPSRDYSIGIRLVGPHAAARLGVEYNEPPLRMLELKVDIFVSLESNLAADTIPMVPSDQDHRAQLEAEMSEQMGERHAYAGSLDAFTFVLASGVLDDCDAESEDAALVSGRLCRDDSGALAHHVLEMIGKRRIPKDTLVLNVWRADVPLPYLEALPGAMRVLHMRFGGLLTFSGDAEQGLYLEERCGFRRVREPVEKLRRQAARSIGLDVEAARCEPEQADVQAGAIAERLIMEQETCPVWLAI